MTTSSTPTTPSTPTTSGASPRRLRTALVGAAVAGGTLFGAAQLGGIVNAQSDGGDGATVTAATDAAETDATDATEAECRELREERREERRQEREEHAQQLAAVLGIDAESLEERLRGGETLAAIAEASGVPVQDVVDHIVAERTASIEERVADGVIDRERADELLDGLEERVTRMVDEGRPDRGDGPGRRGPRGGEGPAGGPPADAPELDAPQGDGEG